MTISCCYNAVGLEVANPSNFCCHGERKTMEELKCCPFCGGKPIFYEDNKELLHAETITSFYIECNDCHCRPYITKIFNLYYKKEKERDKLANNAKQLITERWNTRKGSE